MLLDEGLSSATWSLYCFHPWFHSLFSSIPPSILARPVHIDMIIGCSSVCKIYSGALTSNDNNTCILNLSFNPPLAIGRDLPQQEVEVGVVKFKISHEVLMGCRNGGKSQVRPLACSTHGPCWGHECIIDALSFLSFSHSKKNMFS